MEFAGKTFATGYEFVLQKPDCKDADIPSLFDLCINKLRKMGLNFNRIMRERGGSFLQLFLSPKIPEIVIKDIYLHAYKFKNVKSETIYVEEDDEKLKGRIMVVKEDILESNYKSIKKTEIIKRRIKYSKYKLRCQVIFYDDEWETYEECARSRGLVYHPGFNKIICENCLDNPKVDGLLSYES